jgi:hypothetical protein
LFRHSFKSKQSLLSPTRPAGNPDQPYAHSFAKHSERPQNLETRVLLTASKILSLRFPLHYTRSDDVETSVNLFPFPSSQARSLTAYTSCDHDERTSLQFGCFPSEREGCVIGAMHWAQTRRQFVFLLALHRMTSETPKTLSVATLNASYRGTPKSFGLTLKGMTRPCVVKLYSLFHLWYSANINRFTANQSRHQSLTDQISGAIHLRKIQGYLSSIPG